MTSHLNKKTERVTQLDYAILGLLKEVDRSGYEIRRIFELTAIGNYSSSPGSIYPALKRLLKTELLEVRSTTGSNKKKYRITRQGLSILKGWMMQPISLEDIKKRNKELLLRAAFMDGLVSHERILAFLESFHALTKEYVEELEQYLEVETTQLPLMGGIAFNHGVITYKANLEWCDQAIQTVKSVLKNQDQ
jgi:DNA-binding PadR family transcriptional regulator